MRWEVVLLGLIWVGVTMAWLTAMKGLGDVTWEAARRYECATGFARAKLRLIIRLGLAGMIALFGLGLLVSIKSVNWIWELW